MDEEEHGLSKRAAALMYWSSPVIRNVGSTARDYAALERTFLSHLRLGLVLLVLSASLILSAHLGSHDSPQSVSLTGAAIPLGTLFSVASIACLSAGWLWYDHMAKGFAKQVGFVEDLKVHEVAMMTIALLIFATALLLLVENRSSI